MRKILIAFIITFGIFYSCSEYEKNKSDRNDPKKEVQLNMQKLLMTPDSLRSAKERALIQQIEATIYEHCVIKNGRLELTISKKEWTDMGVKEEVYDMLKKEINDINNYMDTTTFYKQLLLDSYRSAQQEYQEKNNSLHSE